MARTTAFGNAQSGEPVFFKLHDPPDPFTVRLLKLELPGLIMFPTLVPFKVTVPDPGKNVP